VWKLARQDHNVVTYEELLGLGFTKSAIEHRIRKGRLHPKARGVYAVGTPELTREGRWMVAVKQCGNQAVLSHLTAAVHYGIWKREPRQIHVTVPRCANPKPGGVKLHRRGEVVSRRWRGVPVTTIDETVIDCTTLLSRDDVEHLINQADIKGLTDPERLRRAAARAKRRPGARELRRIIDIATFQFTRSQLERTFIPIALRAGLPRPLTAQWVTGYEVDFYWPELKLVIETDGLRYHRTPQQQAKDLARDQKHVASGLTCCRFSHGQIRYEPKRVEAVLRALAERLS
jgi:very-short-patch-repair endonuclease